MTRATVKHFPWTRALLVTATPLFATQLFATPLIAVALLMLISGCESSSNEVVASQTQALTAPAWQPGVGYATGQLVGYQGKIYRVLQGHGSQLGWEPPNVNSLFTYEGEDNGSAPEPLGPVSTEPLTLDTVTLRANCDETPSSCCAPGSTPVTLTAGDDTVASVSPNRCIVAQAGRDTITLQSSGPSSLLLGPGDDTALDGAGDDLIGGGPGNDTINGYGGTNLFFGGAGDDTLYAANGTNTVVPGPGRDTVALGTGNDTVYVFDICEVTSGESLDGGAGTDTLVLPIPLTELTALGVTVANFENIVIEPNSCRSECSGRPACSGGTCRQDASSGAMTCGCDPGFAGASCTTVVDPRGLPDPALPPAPQPRFFSTSGKNLTGPGYYQVPGVLGVPTREQLDAYFGAALPPVPIHPSGFIQKPNVQLTLSLSTSLPGENFPEGYDLRVRTVIHGQDSGWSNLSVTDGDPRDTAFHTRSVQVPRGAPFQVRFEEIEFNQFSDHESVSAVFTVDLDAGTYSGTIESAKIVKTWVFPLPFLLDDREVLSTTPVSGVLGDSQWNSFHGGNQITWTLSSGVRAPDVKVCANWPAYVVEHDRDGGGARTRGYPASFAKYDFRSTGLGGTFSETGQLDADGCLTTPVPAEALAYDFITGAHADVWLKLTGDVKVHEGHGVMTPYPVKKTKDGFGDFVEAIVHLNDFTNVVPGTSSWTLSGFALVPPARLDLTASEENEETAVAANNGVILRRLTRAGVRIPGGIPTFFGGSAAGALDYSCRPVLDSFADAEGVSIGPGFIPSQSGACVTCNVAADCPSGTTCNFDQNVCQAAVDDFTRAHACTLTNDTCTGGQFCAAKPTSTAPGALLPCAPGSPDCVCAYRGQGNWYTVNSHEFGHAVQSLLAGEHYPATDYGFVCPGGGTSCTNHGSRLVTFDGNLVLEDPPGITDPACKCLHIQAANGLHCLQSVELTGAAQGEGYAQYFASWVWSPPSGSGGRFFYYKEYRHPNGTIEFPPVWIDADNPAKMRNHHCGSLGTAVTSHGRDVTLTSSGTEQDWMTFLRSLASSGIDFPEVMSIYRYANHAPFRCNFPRDCPYATCEDDPSTPSTETVCTVPTSEPGPKSMKTSDETGAARRTLSWIDDLSKQRVGFLSGAIRKWGSDTAPKSLAVRDRGFEHGVDNNVP